MLDLKYKPETMICVEKPGSDDYDADIMTADLARENGINIPEKSAKAKIRIET
ncbi:hypothetical protein KJ966_22915 [bacterium]|nr:hypothetical protein [bacterium]